VSTNLNNRNVPLRVLTEMMVPKISIRKKYYPNQDSVYNLYELAIVMSWTDTTRNARCRTLC